MTIPNPATLVTHLAEVPELQFTWGTLRWLCNDQLLPGARQTFGVCHLFAGQGNPLHYHPNCEEVLHVLSGSGRHRIDDQWIALRAGATIRIPAGVRHQFISDAMEDLVCIIAFSSGDRQTVFLE